MFRRGDFDLTVERAAIDVIDPFKFADWEWLPLFVLDQRLAGKDFKIQDGRRGSNFHYRRPSSVAKLDQIGEGADDPLVRHDSHDVYGHYAVDLLERQGLQESGGHQSLDARFLRHTVVRIGDRRLWNP